jgi:phosphoglycolate phosphatase
MSNRALVIFDLDGTLVDSANEVLVCLNMMKEQRSQTLLHKQGLLSFMGHGAQSIVEAAFTDTRESIELLIEEFRSNYSAIKTAKASMYKHVIELLSWLRDNNCIVALLTNKPKLLCDNVLNELEIRQYFNFIIANDGQCSLKPSPDGIKHLMTYFDVNSNSTFMVGDTTLDQKAAHMSEVNFIHFSQGYNDGVKLASYDAEVSDLLEIKTLIQSYRGDLNE